MKNKFKEELDKVTDAYTQIFGKVSKEDNLETINDRLEYVEKIKSEFIDKFQNAGIPYIPEHVEKWFNHHRIVAQRQLGLSVREIFYDIDQNEYEYFTNLDLLQWDNVVDWVNEHEEDFIYLWLNESYKVIIKETYYLYNPFENGYVSDTDGVTHNPNLNGKKYSISDINDIDPKLIEWAVRIDEV